MKITLMLTENCSHHDQARELLKEAVAESGVEAEVEEVMVRTDEEAHDAKVIGSPTIRIEGLDIEHPENEPPESSPNCRYYNSPAGWQPMPDKGMILRAIERAQAG
ncbi:MAG: thioredoxin family protein [Dehalococcoidia bacterium]